MKLNQRHIKNKYITFAIIAITIYIMMTQTTTRKSSTEKIGISYLLRNIPPDVREVIIDEQARLKKMMVRNVSMERIIYRIIREWNNKKEEEK